MSLVAPFEKEETGRPDCSARRRGSECRICEMPDVRTDEQQKRGS